jgi:hypothetical protein
MKELEYDNQIQLNQVIPQLNGKVLINNILKTGYPINIEKLYLDNNLKGTLNTNINVKLFMINAYKNLEIDIQNLIEQIKKELENRKSRT